MAVQPRAFAEGLARFKGEHLLSSINDLRQLQKTLKELGHYRGRIDGLFGNGTRKAVIAFEREEKLIALGLPTRELLIKMLEKIEAKDNNSSKVEKIDNANQNKKL